MDIELIPNIDGKSGVRQRLRNSVETCISLKGAVAYWTIDINFIPGLGKKLQEKDSFMCVDFQTPTNIDRIAEYVETDKSNFYIHLYKAAVVLDENKKESHLMHAKLLHFDYGDGKTETWIGSHNFTSQALMGFNIEVSAIIKTKGRSKKDIDFVEQVNTHLSFIKKQTTKFKVKDVDFYKVLQYRVRHDDEFYVVEIAGKDIESLNKDEGFSLISKDDSNFKRFQLVVKDVFIHALDIGKNKDYLFKARISNAGIISKNLEKTYDITFSRRRPALRENNMLPYLHPETIIDQDLLKISTYYVNFKIDCQIHNFKVFEKPERKGRYWEYVKTSAHIKRMRLEDKKALFKSKSPIKKGSNEKFNLKEIKLEKIICKSDIEYLTANYEEDKYAFKHKTAAEIEESAEKNQGMNIPKAIAKKDALIKRIIKIHRQQSLFNELDKE